MNTINKVTDVMILEPAKHYISKYNAEQRWLEELRGKNPQTTMQEAQENESYNGCMSHYIPTYYKHYFGSNSYGQEWKGFTNFPRIRSLIIKPFYLSVLNPKNIIKAVFLPKQLPILILANFMKEILIDTQPCHEMKINYIHRPLLTRFPALKPKEKIIFTVISHTCDIAFSTIFTLIFFRFLYKHIPELHFLHPIRDIIEAMSFYIHKTINENEN